MPSAVTANSAGYAQPDNGSTPNVAAVAGGGKQTQQKGQKPGVPAGKPGGEIVISRAEAAALRSFETEPPERAARRAREESGLSDNQIRKLKARADRARKGGFTLKGANLVLKPTNHPEETDQHGLLKDDEDEGDPKAVSGAAKLAQDKKAAAGAKASDKKAEKKPAKKVKENDFDATVEAMVTKALDGESLDPSEADSIEDLIESAVEMSDDEFAVLSEKWSEAARAASAAARRTRANGGDWRKAGRAAFAKSKQGRDAEHGVSGHDASRTAAYGPAPKDKKGREAWAKGHPDYMDSDGKFPNRGPKMPNVGGGHGSAVKMPNAAGAAPEKKRHAGPASIKVVKPSSKGRYGRK